MKIACGFDAHCLHQINTEAHPPCVEGVSEPLLWKLYGDSSHAGIAQLVEHLLAKQKVAGSSPVPRSIVIGVLNLSPSSFHEIPIERKRTGLTRGLFGEASEHEDPEKWRASCTHFQPWWRDWNSITVKIRDKEGNEAEADGTDYGAW